MDKLQIIISQVWSLAYHKAYHDPIIRDCSSNEEHLSRRAWIQADKELSIFIKANIANIRKLDPDYEHLEEPPEDIKKLTDMIRKDLGIKTMPDNRKETE